MNAVPGNTDGENAARAAVRDELARRGEALAWLARSAGVDAGTVGDFVSGSRWPRLETLVKFDGALGWAPGTLDRVAHGLPAEPLPAGVDATALRALQRALDEQILQATSEWVTASIQARAASLAVEAAEKKRAQLISERLRLTEQIDTLERFEGRSDEQSPTMPVRRASDPEGADFTERRNA